MAFPRVRFARGGGLALSLLAAAVPGWGPRSRKSISADTSCRCCASVVLVAMKGGGVGAGIRRRNRSRSACDRGAEGEEVGCWRSSTAAIRRQHATRLTAAPGRTRQPNWRDESTQGYCGTSACFPNVKRAGSSRFSTRPYRCRETMIFVEESIARLNRQLERARAVYGTRGD